MTIDELDAIGNWRTSLRRRGFESIRAMTSSDKLQLSGLWNKRRRAAVRERLFRRRPDLTEAAIRDMLVNHALRDSEYESAIAERVAAERGT
jgi:hypothetical protein